MTIERAREEFPQWAMITVTGPQRRVIDDAEWTDAAEPKKLEWKLPISDRTKEFWKKHMILIVVCLFLPLWTAGACWITASIVRHNTEVETADRVRHEMNGQMQNYIDRQEQERMAAGLLTGEASLQAQKEEDAEYLAKLSDQYKTKRMKQTVMCNAWARMKNENYPNTIKAVVSQANQFQFWSENNPVKADDYALAMELLDELYAGRYPSGFDDKFIYGEWSPNDYVLRDTWQKDSSTNYWRYPE